METRLLSYDRIHSVGSVVDGAVIGVTTSEFVMQTRYSCEFQIFSRVFDAIHRPSYPSTLVKNLHAYLGT